MKPAKRKPKFKVGQIVVDRIENLPRVVLRYFRGWVEITPACGSIQEGHRMFPEQLRPLTKREAGR